MRKPFKYKIECPLCDFVAQERTAKETRDVMMEHLFSRTGMHFWSIHLCGCPCCGTLFYSEGMRQHAMKNFKTFIRNIRLRMMGVTTGEPNEKQR